MTYQTSQQVLQQAQMQVVALPLNDVQVSAPLEVLVLVLHQAEVLEESVGLLVLQKVLQVLGPSCRGSLLWSLLEIDQ